MYDLQLNLQPGRPDHDLLRIGRDCLTISPGWVSPIERVGTASATCGTGRRDVRCYNVAEPLSGSQCRTLAGRMAETGLDKNWAPTRCEAVVLSGAFNHCLETTRRTVFIDQIIGIMEKHLVNKIIRMEPTGSTFERRFRPFGLDLRFVFQH